MLARVRALTSIASRLPTLLVRNPETHSIRGYVLGGQPVLSWAAVANARAQPVSSTWSKKIDLRLQDCLAFPDIAPSRSQLKQILLTAQRCVSSPVASVQDVLGRTDDGHVYLDTFVETRKGNVYNYYRMFVGDTQCGAVFDNESQRVVAVDTDGELSEVAPGFSAAIAAATELANKTKSKFQPLTL